MAARDSLTELIARGKACQIPQARMKRVLLGDMENWDKADLERIFDRLDPFVSKAGNSDPCGPKFDQAESSPIMGKLVQLTSKAAGTSIGRPKSNLLASIANLQIFIKPSESLVKESITQKKALCVNRLGEFKLIGPQDEENYAVLSYVWGDLMAWQKPKQWGAVDLSVRRQGLNLEHLERLFDVCCEDLDYSSPDEKSPKSSHQRKYDYEWMWLDVLAMPEVLENMSTEEQNDTDALRVGVINNLASIYSSSGRITVADFLLRRLRTGSLLDCAVVLCFTKWLSRVWTYIECQLAHKVVIRTADYAFDLDDIIVFLTGMINNVQHRYFGLLRRLSYLRPTPNNCDRIIFRNAEDHQLAREGGKMHILKDIPLALEHRQTNIRVDHVRPLFPLLGLEWDVNWDVFQGFDGLRKAFPEYGGQISEIYQCRLNVIKKPGCIVAKLWDNNIVDAGRALGY